MELRLYGVDPDQAEAAARRRDAVVLVGAADKEHGLREAYIVDDDGYVWVEARVPAFENVRVVLVISRRAVNPNTMCPRLQGESTVILRFCPTVFPEVYFFTGNNPGIR